MGWRGICHLLMGKDSPYCPPEPARPWEMGDVELYRLLEDIGNQNCNENRVNSGLGEQAEEVCDDSMTHYRLADNLLGRLDNGDRFGIQEVVDLGEKAFRAGDTIGAMRIFELILDRTNNPKIVIPVIAMLERVYDQIDKFRSNTGTTEPLRRKTPLKISEMTEGLSVREKRLFMVRLADAKSRLPKQG